MARREYARIGTDMPDEPSVRACSHDEQWLYDHALYLRKELSRCGVIPYRPAVWAELASDTTEAKCRRWLKGLEKRRMVVTDERYSEVFLRTFVRWDGLLGQPNVVANMVADFRLIASPKIRAAFLAELRRLWDLDSLTDGDRGGWQLAMGHYPQPKTDKGQTWPDHIEAATLSRLRKAIGPGLASAMHQQIVEGSVTPFTEGSAGGIPEPFTRTPYAGAIAVSAVSVSERRNRAPQPGGSKDPGAADAARGGHTPKDLLATHQAQLGKLPDLTVKDLTRHVATALGQGATTDHILAGLEEWRRRPDARPGLVLNLIGDAQKTAGQRQYDDDPLAHPDVATWVAEQEAAQR